LFGPEAPEILISNWTYSPENPEDVSSPREPRKILTREDEAQLFLRLNYARYRLGELTGKQLKRFSVARLEEMICWYRRERATLGSIVDANMALVMTMARRTRIRNVDFPELVSEGNMALLRAIEKFDVSRGFKFSTYACRAIIQCYNRMSARAGRYSQFFSTEFNLEWELRDYSALRHQGRLNRVLDSLMEMLSANRAGLTDVERTVVTQRFALGSQEKGKTLNEVGMQLNLTVERVRQIQKGALAKLRRTLDREYLACRKR